MCWLLVGLVVAAPGGQRRAIEPPELRKTLDRGAPACKVLGAEGARPIGADLGVDGPGVPPIGAGLAGHGSVQGRGAQCDGNQQANAQQHR